MSARPMVGMRNEIVDIPVRSVDIIMELAHAHEPDEFVRFPKPDEAVGVGSLRFFVDGAKAGRIEVWPEVGEEWESAGKVRLS